MDAYLRFGKGASVTRGYRAQEPYLFGPGCEGLLICEICTKLITAATARKTRPKADG